MLAIWIWLGLIVLFVVAEAVTHELVSLWFICGAVASFAAALFHAPVWLQVALFVAVSVVMLLLLRPIVKRRVEPQLTPTNADMVIGKIGVVSIAVNNDAAAGRVVVDGQDWAARSYDGERIKVGKNIVVHAIDGVKLIVVPQKEDI